MSKAYVTNTDSDDISVVDLSTKIEISRVSIGGSPRGSVRFDPFKNFGYVSNCAGNTISVIDLHRDREVAKIVVGMAPRGITLSPDGKLAYVSNSGDNTLSVVDLTDRKELKKIAMGENPRHMAFLPKANRLLVTQWGSDTLANLDMAASNLSPIMLAAISVGEGARPYSLTPKSDGTVAYVANTQADYVSVIDVATGTERARVKVGYGGRAIVLSADEKYAFVTVENTNEVAVIDTTSNTVVNSVKVGPSPRGIAIDKTNQTILTANFTRGESMFGLDARNSLSIVNIANPLRAEVIGHISVGLGPCSVSVLE